MKKIVALLLLVPLSGCAEQKPTLVRTMDLRAQETFVQLYPADGFVHIKEYVLDTTRPDASGIEGQARLVSELVGRAEFCTSRFGLPGFKAMKERVFRDRGFITVECRLLTREKNVRAMRGSVFGSVLNRPVDVTLEGDEIGPHFEGDIDVRSTNALGAFEKDGRIAVFWRNGDRYYEAVFAEAGSKADGATALALHFGADVASPEMSKEEIDAWKRAEQ